MYNAHVITRQTYFLFAILYHILPAPMPSTVSGIEDSDSEIECDLADIAVRMAV